MSTAIAIYLTARERDTILAALRHYQDHIDGGAEAPHYDIATNGLKRKPMTGEQIDTLCEKVNV